MMMAVYVQPGEIINYRNAGAEEIAYGEVVTIGERIGVATIDIAAGAVGTLEIGGVYEMPAEATAEFKVGQTLYWDGAKHCLTATKADSGAVLAGMAVKPKATAGATALVRL